MKNLAVNCLLILLAAGCKHEEVKTPKGKPMLIAPYRYNSQEYMFCPAATDKFHYELYERRKMEALGVNPPESK